jgi:hypothetical protein
MQSDLDNVHHAALKELRDAIGDTLIVRNGLVVGVCECKGRGKGRCLGNGWAKHKLKTAENDEPSFSFNKCKYIKNLDSKDD